MFSITNKQSVFSKLAIVGLLLAVPAVLSAAVTVDNISLKKQGKFTEVTVYVSDAVEFEHSIVEPGAGKPYRVVLDLNDARHMLPHYNFDDLPSQTVTSIRTSQFSVNPEKIVRIVLDVRGHVTYKISESQNTVTLVIATPDDSEFPFWCAQPLSEAEKIQLALGEGSNTKGTSKADPGKDQKSSPVLVSSKVSGSPDSGPKIPAQAEPTATTKTKKSPKSDDPVMATNVMKGLPEADLPITTTQTSEEPVVALDKKEPVASEADKPNKNILVHKPTPVEPTPWQVPAEPLVLLAQTDDNRPAAQNEADDTPTPKVIEEKKNNSKQSGFTDSAASMKPQTPGMNEDMDSGDSSPAMPTPAKPSDRGKSDSEQYRINPDKPTKTKGTLAERFPKRKVVQYSSWGSRDPFAQLIDRAHGREPGEIPDVETLRLVGVLQGDDGSSALLEDVEGYGYILKDGDPVRNGYVVQIGEKKIIFQIQEYGWSRTVALKIETEN